MYADKAKIVHTSAIVFRVMLCSVHTCFYELLVGSIHQSIDGL